MEEKRLKHKENRHQNSQKRETVHVSWANHRLVSRCFRNTTSPPPQKKNNSFHVKHKPWFCNRMSFMHPILFCCLQLLLVGSGEIGRDRASQAHQNKTTYKKHGKLSSPCTSVVQLNWAHWVHDRKVDSENKNTPRTGLEGKQKIEGR